MLSSNRLIASAVCGLAALATSSTASAASVTYTDFSGNGWIPGLSVTVNDHEFAGDLSFVIKVDTTQGYIADILGFYFDLTNDSLATGLEVISGTDITDKAFSANNVIDLGNGNNMNGSIDPFDAGVQFGQNGIGNGKGDYQEVALRISHLTQSLTLADLGRIGLRLQSVGELNSNRGGSSKLVATPPTSVVPTPAAAGLGLALLGFTALRRRDH